MTVMCNLFSSIVKEINSDEQHTLTSGTTNTTVREKKVMLIDKRQDIWLTCSTVARSAFSVVFVLPIAISLKLPRIAVVTEFDMPTLILPSHSCNPNQNPTEYHLIQTIQ